MAKAILYKSKKLSNGEHPVVIRWYENGKQRVFTVGSCTPAQWNEAKGLVKKNHPFYEQLNDRIRERLIEAIKSGSIAKEGVGNGGDAVLHFIEKLGERSAALGQLAQKDKYKQLSDDLLRWKAAAGKWGFDKFTKKEIESFYLFLISDAKGNSKNTAARKMSRLSTVFRNARRAGISANDPFLDLSFTRQSVIKRKLTREEFSLIESADLSGAARGVQLARDSFVMQFYLRGLRIGDVLTLTDSNIDGGRVLVEEGKTGSVRSIPIRKEVAAIIERWKGQSEYLLPILKYRPLGGLARAENALKRKKAIESATTLINTNLEKLAGMVGIDKKLTTHIARHTFAKLAIDTVKNIRVSQELLGHKSLRVHQDYIRDLQDNDELDKAADDVFGD